MGENIIFNGRRELTNTPGYSEKSIPKMCIFRSEFSDMKHNFFYCFYLKRLSRTLPAPNPDTTCHLLLTGQLLVVRTESVPCSSPSAMVWFLRYLPSFHNGRSRQPSGNPIAADLSGTYSSMRCLIRATQDVPGLISFRRYPNMIKVL